MLERIETDELGSMKIPLNAYYGIATLRSKEMFSITKEKINKQMIKSLATVKKACCLANYDAKYLSLEITKAICDACDEVIHGRFNNQFITDAIQGGAGLGLNMNMNEVIANRANEMLGGKLGTYDIVHPLKHVNLFQSTNDVIPSSAKIAVLLLSKQLISEIKKLQKALNEKASLYKNVIKLGRTHLQDSLPISFGLEFKAIAATLSRDLQRLTHALEELKIINLGAGEIGVSEYAADKYVKHIIKRINEALDDEYKRPTNILDNTRNLDSFVNVSHTLKLIAINLSKTASDLRLMASGPKSGFNEITIPSVELSHGLLEGKANPVVPELVNQVCFQVIGKATTITLAAEHGQFELNVFGPIVYPNLFDSIEYLTRALKILRESTIENLVVNQEVCEKSILNSSSIAVCLLPKLGINTTIEVIGEARKTNKTVKEIVVSKGLLTSDEADSILTIENIVKL